MTQSYAITAESRTITGNDVRKLRKSGQVPGVLYGNGIQGVMIQIPYNDFVKLYTSAGRTHVIEVTTAGKTYPCLINDIDVDPVRDTARHVDFYVVNLKEKVTVTVPIEFTGEAPAVVQGNIVNISIHEVEVEALPNKVPESLSVDLSTLVTLSDNIHIKDLPVTADYVILADPELVVASVVEPEPEVVATPVTETPATEAAQAATPEAPAPTK